MRNFSAIRTTLAGCLSGLLIGSASFSYADDTEIFFGGPSIDSGVRPNVLFILDNSGSMAWGTTYQSNAKNGDQSRMEILKESFSNIINGAGDINAGIMVLNGTRVVYPVSRLNDPLPGSVVKVASTPKIILSGDDAVQVDGAGTATIDSPALYMGKFAALAASTTNYTLAENDAFLEKSNTSCMLKASLASSRPNSSTCNGIDQDTVALSTSSTTGTALLFFSGLSIPAGSTVTSATLAVTSKTTTGSFTPRVQAEQNKIASPFNDNTLTTLAAANRSFSAWRNLSARALISGTPTIIDITTELNNLRGLTPASAWVENLALRLGATNNSGTVRNFCMRTGANCGPAELPILTISYTAAASTQTQTTSLRFQNVGIPQGATISSARIDFAPAVSNAETPSFTVKAELADDAVAFTASGAGVPSARAKTAGVPWGPVQWTAKNPAGHVPGPDVGSLVQQVVNRGDWCGNNAMAFFIEHASGNGALTAHSFDGASGLQPTLTVTYTGGDNGCLNPFIETRVSTANNDGYEDSDGKMSLTGSTLPVKSSRFAARYIKIPINKNATILETQVILTPANTISTGLPISSTIRFEDADDSAPFTTSNNNITNRSDTSNSTCSITSWKAGVPVICDGSELRSGLQSIVNRSGWEPNNAVTVMSLNANSSLTVKAFEGSPAESIKLRIKVAHGGLLDSTYTNRQHINALVQELNANGGTPIVPTYYDAAKYIRGELGSRPSPITSACQPTHVVMLTDGQANGNGAQSNIASLAGSCSTAIPVESPTTPGVVDSGTTDSDEQCGRKLSQWLALSDQSTLPDNSYVFTHTIGFALDAMDASGSAATKSFLDNIASNGQGKFYDSNTASQLTKAFGDILGEVQDVDTTFVSASAPVNSFERQDNKDELYFSLFSPTQKHRWPGNLKRFRFSLDMQQDGQSLGPGIVDAANRPAVDLESGNFNPAIRSFWSENDDGNNTDKGGAAANLPPAAERKLYTYTGVTPSFASPASLTSHALATSNNSISNSTLGIISSGAAAVAERTALFNYIRGLDPEDNNSERKALGDPIHASPRLATYSCLEENPSTPTLCNKDDQIAFIGTNEGFVQAINTDTGVEEFAFMPQELLGNIKKLKENAQSSSLNPRPYGMDNPVTLWVNDVNGDGKIFATSGDLTPQTDEFIYAYATMGRGGRGLYALDVTHRSSPKLLWYITGGVTPGFNMLGQTWSAPVRTSIQIGAAGPGNPPTDVLVFAGGYDVDQDKTENAVRAIDDVGTALYVVNAKTGALIWSASNEATNPSAAGHLSLNKMQYSMPAGVRVIDLQTSPTGVLVVDPKRLADQLFVGDMGGQVWRFYINNGGSGAGLITAGGTGGDGVFATAIPGNYSSLDLLGQQQNLRRFYNEPDVALLNKNGKLSLSINIGSGWRGHPLRKEAHDRFYSFRTSNLTNALGTEGTVTESDLLDITNNFSPDASQQVTLSLSDDRDRGGWYFGFPLGSGEKVLTRALTAGAKNTLYFGTYEPAAANNNDCKPAYGTARGYAINLFDGSPLELASPGNPTFADRYDVLAVPGIPPQPELICLGDHCFVIKGPGNIEEIEMPKQGKMYWIDQID